MESPGPYSGPRGVGVRPKGRKTRKSGHRGRREEGESYERKTSRRVSHDQKNYQSRKSPPRRTETELPVKPRRQKIPKEPLIVHKYLIPKYITQIFSSNI